MCSDNIRWFLSCWIISEYTDLFQSNYKKPCLKRIRRFKMRSVATRMHNFSEMWHVNPGAQYEASSCCKDGSSELTVGFSKGGKIMLWFDDPSDQHSAWSALTQDWLTVTFTRFVANCSLAKESLPLDTAVRHTFMWPTQTSTSCNFILWHSEFKCRGNNTFLCQSWGFVCHREAKPRSINCSTRITAVMYYEQCEVLFIVAEWNPCSFVHLDSIIFQDCRLSNCYNL